MLSFNWPLFYAISKYCVFFLFIRFSISLPIIVVFGHALDMVKDLYICSSVLLFHLIQLFCFYSFSIFFFPHFSIWTCTGYSWGCVYLQLWPAFPSHSVFFFLFLRFNIFLPLLFVFGQERDMVKDAYICSPFLLSRPI